MNDIIETLKRKQKEYNLARLVYHIGRRLKITGFRGVAIAYETDESPLKIFFVLLLRVILVFTLFCIQEGNLIGALICYGIIHIAFVAIGIPIEMVGEVNLCSVTDFANEIYDEYRAKREKECNIENDSAILSDGTRVSSGSVEIPISNSYGFIRIYQKLNKEEKTEYKEYIKENKSSDMNNIITSTQFTEKFFVVSDENNAHNCLKYLTPSVQNNMINNADKLSNFKHLRINNFSIMAETEFKVDYLPLRLTFDDDAKLTIFIERIDSYCKDMLDMANKVEAILNEVYFIVR